MAEVSLRVRALGLRGLYYVLFPFVFAITAVELAPESWRDAGLKTAAGTVLLGLGLACAAATGGRLY